jgi:hypothetical protein
MGKVTRLVSAAKSAGFGLESSPRNFPAGSSMDFLDLAEHYNIEEDLAGETSIEEVASWAAKLLKLSNNAPTASTSTI